MRIRQNVSESALHLPFTAGRVHYSFSYWSSPTKDRRKDTEGTRVNQELITIIISSHSNNQLVCGALNRGSAFPSMILFNAEDSPWSTVRGLVGIDSSHVKDKKASQAKRRDGLPQPVARAESNKGVLSAHVLVEWSGAK